MTDAQLSSLPASELLAWAIETYRERFAIVTAFQPEGMVLVDMALKLAPATRLITVDTGRLPQATYDMMDAVRAHYGAPVEVVLPDAGEVERMVTRHGVNLFRAEPPLRKLCCEIRKVRPLARRLATVDAWASGLRRGQSAERADTPIVDRSSGPQLKLNPLAAWTQAEVEAYAETHGVPMHPLLRAGYATVGCEPCSRAISPGEDARAGRWWWEQDGGKECGIHVSPTGKMRRTLDVLLDEILH
ncbi:MAG: phosphoadenylyl-sulfate reductase [Bryobacterales bacterium]|nr:phosphoadenylyl-sulfate reductase [Bryobacterales bacterium]